MPKKPERFDSWEAFVASEPPPLPAVEAKRFALFDEMKFWPQPRDVDNPPGPDDYHDEIVRLYGTAYRLNGVDRATAQDQTNSLFNPLQLAAAFAIVTSIFVAAIGALWWLFAN